ncbi:hypothetical protein [Rhodococcus sp. P1Y]|uniref:hypothetical protein n=1 Tax=Rhodococcus sp. P1Y TaxID=1302308 RepID=UPI000EAFA6E0|nr:hypothetical protein [Rhodococcus sp. P1Y]AYJ51934.1 hypothetical protein D8W71_16900 [Rhodococcus sp. P1Y]
MNDRRTPWRTVVAVASASACLLVSGCSDNSSPEDANSVNVEPLSSVSSPETSTPPSGSVAPSPSGLHSITFEASTRSVVALDDASTSALVFDTDAFETAPRSVPLPAAAADIVSAGDGTLLLPMDGQLALLDVRSSEVRTLPVDGTLLSAAPLDGGRIAVGDSSGTIHILDADANESQRIDGLSSVDALAETEHGLAALDRHQTSLTKIDADGGSLGVALRAGTGAARLDTDEYGRILVTDAAGGELLVYSSDDLLLRQRFPVGAQPWAVTYDDKSDIVWVSTPGDNGVVGYTLDTGIPVEAARFTSVKQPDSIAVDPGTGDVYVGSAAGDGLQRIPARP